VSKDLLGRAVNFAVICGLSFDAATTQRLLTTDGAAFDVATRDVVITLNCAAVVTRPLVCAQIVRFVAIFDSRNAGNVMGDGLRALQLFWLKACHFLAPELYEFAFFPGEFATSSGSASRPNTFWITTRLNSSTLWWRRSM
jgi:hypothetical protein